MAESPDAAWREAYDKFHRLLRTETFPVGKRIAGLQEIMAHTGVSRDQARRVLRELGDRGELEINVGRYGSLVLPAPDPDDLGNLLRELNEAQTALERAQERVREIFKRVRRAQRAQRARERAQT